MITLLPFTLLSMAAIGSGVFFWQALGRHAVVDGVFYGLLLIVFSLLALSFVGGPDLEEEDEDYGD